MLIIALVRCYSPSSQNIFDGGWNIADRGQRAYGVEGVTTGTAASGHVGLAVLRRLYPFNVDRCCVDRRRLPELTEKGLNSAY